MQRRDFLTSAMAAGAAAMTTLSAKNQAAETPTKKPGIKLGLYSITYRGVWYKGPALDSFQLVREAKKQGWEGLELSADRPHASPLDFDKDARKKLRDLSGELEIPICAVSPNCNLSSPLQTQYEAMICYVRECIKLTSDIGSPICKILAASRGYTMGDDGVASYELTGKHEPWPYWKKDRRPLVVAALKELTKTAGDYGVVIALQNHGPDIINDYKDVLAMIRDVGSPYLKGSMDMNCEPDGESDKRAWDMARDSGPLQVHSHLNGEFKRDADGKVVLIASGYFDKGYWGRKIAYPAYFEALTSIGYNGFYTWEYCHPAIVDGKYAGIDYVNDQTKMALEYMRELRKNALAKNNAK
ncbi:MAG: sugar phosphate isomerase/epimerase [Planctomycetaceae bacterium]|nr:sugar phosphate isomerase/epimerase [Planctomycetaceae bacterium]